MVEKPEKSRDEILARPTLGMIDEPEKERKRGNGGKSCLFYPRETWEKVSLGGRARVCLICTVISRLLLHPGPLVG